MFWAILIGVGIVAIVIDVIIAIGNGIDQSMNNNGLSEQDKHNVWTGLAIWSSFWGSKK